MRPNRPKLPLHVLPQHRLFKDSHQFRLLVPEPCAVLLKIEALALLPKSAQPALPGLQQELVGRRDPLEPLLPTAVGAATIFNFPTTSLFCFDLRGVMLIWVMPEREFPILLLNPPSRRLAVEVLDLEVEELKLLQSTPHHGRLHGNHLRRAAQETETCC